MNRAEAYLTLSNVDAAIGSYEDALERERLDPHLLTYAYLDLPLLIVKLRLSHLYSRALQILDTHLSRVMFPMDRYVANGARALILQEQGDETGAGLCAERALAAASEVQSGFRYHQDVGLVGDIDDDFGRRLQTLVASRR